MKMRMYTHVHTNQLGRGFEQLNWIHLAILSTIGKFDGSFCWSKMGFPVKRIASAWWEGPKWSVNPWFCSCFSFKLYHEHRHKQALLDWLNLSGKALLNYRQRSLARHFQVCLQTGLSNRDQVCASVVLLGLTGLQWEEQRLCRALKLLAQR